MSGGQHKYIHKKKKMFKKKEEKEKKSTLLTVRGIRGTVRLGRVGLEIVTTFSLPVTFRATTSVFFNFFFMADTKKKYDT